MIDLNTHKVVESREKNMVAKWLSSFPNISIVSRDDSLIYLEKFVIKNYLKLKIK